MMLCLERSFLFVRRRYFNSTEKVRSNVYMSEQELWRSLMWWVLKRLFIPQEHIERLLILKIGSVSFSLRKIRATNNFFLFTVKGP